TRFSRDWSSDVCSSDLVSAQAQVRSEPPLVAEGDQLVLEAMDQRMVLPMPDWLSEAQRRDGDVRSHLEAVYVADETQALLEIYRSEERRVGKESRMRRR